ncbi:MAG: pseudaminic acid biosynthesis-associated methylase [Firmicutes bacterium HGW-Firmicutes-15]|nr:MAG: pseudaminic acid biosynthesis-associated methylase [Firmicutes bacterium HGW-Firmicutes-15]
MKDNFSTEQEKFWAGTFGNEYTERNSGNELIARNLGLFAPILSKTAGIQSILEIGANRGLNLIALKSLLPKAICSAIEINVQAAEVLSSLGFVEVYNQSIFNFEPDYKRDFVLSKGVLIHIAPEMLSKVYDLLYKSSQRYICLAEYYNPTPVEVVYRGHENKLFKRDFAGEMLDKYSDLQLLNYGFAYHRDQNFTQDDFTWFLLEKKQ